VRTSDVPTFAYHFYYSRFASQEMRDDILRLVKSVEEGLSLDATFKDKIINKVIVFKRCRWFEDSYFDSLDDVASSFESFDGLQFMTFGVYETNTKMVRSTSTMCHGLVMKSWNEISVRQIEPVI
jgi:hypothetical protein